MQARTSNYLGNVTTPTLKNMAGDLKQIFWSLLPPNIFKWRLPNVFWSNNDF